MIGQYYGADIFCRRFLVNTWFAVVQQSGWSSPWITGELRDVKYAESSRRNRRQNQAQQDAKPKGIDPISRQPLAEHSLDDQDQRDQNRGRKRIMPCPSSQTVQHRREPMQIHEPLRSRMRFNSSISDGFSFSLSTKRAKNGAISPPKNRLRNCL